MPIVTLADCPVDYTISRTESVLKADESGYSDEITFDVAYEDALTFFNWAGGLVHSIESPVGSGFYVQRIIPLSHPEISTMIVRGLSMQRYGTQAETTNVHTLAALFSRAKITATFKSVPWPTDGSSPFMEIETQKGAEVYTIGTAKYRFADGTPIDADCGVVIPTSTFSISIYSCPVIGTAESDPLLGKLNITEFMGKPPGTVRYDGMSTKFSKAANFVDQWSRHMSFAYRPIPWNYFLHPSGDWLLALKPDGSPAYEPAELNVLVST
jgi:hypothetical protein